MSDAKSQEAEILHLYHHENRSLAETAALVGCSPGKVRRVLAADGRPIRAQGRRRDPHRAEVIREGRTQDPPRSFRELGEELGISGAACSKLWRSMSSSADTCP